MTRHFVREIEKLKERLLALCAVVEETVYDAMRALRERDLVLAQKIIDSDTTIDESEVEIEEECLKILALHQPVATDLRYVVAILKINNDLERIGDTAGNIAARAKSICALGSVDLPPELEEMTIKTKKMVRDSLQSLINLDADMARGVCHADVEIDQLNRRMYDLTHSAISKDSSRSESYIMILSVSRNLERIADLTTNIAEDVIYLIEGEIVRHRI
ncbi:MAG: phosphate signaling complex protein PhoU [Deltaproteobacteria bacterium]|nr:phosphate signaling complex protein PhoU [Deltaproteobacteria bacterium]